jgi:hypothetical protein
MAREEECLFPIQNLHKVVIFGILDIFSCSPVVRFSNVMQVALKDYLHRLRLHIHQTRLHFTILILYIFQIERRNAASTVDGGYTPRPSLVA